MWFDSQRGRDPEASGEPCSRVNRADILAGNHWFLFFEFQVAAGRVFWDGVIIVTTVFDDYDFPCFTWATRDLA